MSQDLELVQFKPGEILFNENDESFYFFMIKEGKVEVFRTGADGARITLATVDEGQSLGEFAMIDRQPRSASAQAITDVTAVKISEIGYESLLNELPTWARAMMEGLVTRLRKANEIIQMHESIDDDTKSDFKATEFDSDSNVKFDFDFGQLEIDENYTPDSDGESS